MRRMHGTTRIASLTLWLAVTAVHISECMAKREAYEARALAAKGSEDKECVVCMDVVATKRDPRFGLLTCDHCVCLDCIRTWRTRDDMGTAKSCPICRSVTHLVVPSDRWPVDAADKELITDDYRTSLSKINCRHFNFGDGTCPFSTSCLYRHADRAGVEIQPTLRFISGQDIDEHGVHVMREVKLFDFLEQYEARQSP
ncbi:hypothetical protein BC831DRAFT_441714 [Entophlyctis helioformis]|nr:hypothetical protein BC831DRAFT_441714 [Entophlyctis helioformis]